MNFHAQQQAVGVSNDSFLREHPGKAIAANSVISQADNAQESAARVRYFAESMLAELRQQPECQTGPQPFRSGIDGKLADAAEHSNVALSTLQEIRAYLLG